MNSIMTLIPALYRAWKAGQIIRNPEIWKSGGELTLQVGIVISGLCTLIIFFVPGATEFLSQETQSLLTTIGVAIFGLIAIVIGRATTKKEVGLHVFLEDTKDGPSQGRRDEDVKIPEADRRAYDKRHMGSSSELGSGTGKVTPQGKDDL